VKRKVTAYFHIYRSEDGLFRVDELNDAVTYADQCDGKLALSTNNRTRTPEELNTTYRDLQEVERSFRTLKSFLKIRPTYHWTENRVRAHVLVCVLSLVVERVMRLRLKSAGSSYSPASALEELANLTRVSLTLPTGEKRQLLANSSPVQMDLFKCLEVTPLTNSRLNKISP
jgi:transposase